MDNLKFWTIRKEDKRLAKTIGHEFDRIWKSRPKGLEIDFLDPPELKSLLENETYFVVGQDLGNLLGYAHCIVTEPVIDVGDGSFLFQRGDVSLCQDIVDMDGNPVRREDIKKFNGYKNYQGRGRLAYIPIFETFVRRRGIGSRLLDFVKEQDFELIELKANGYEPSKFFEVNGFVDAQMDSQQGNQIVMVWNNPSYSRND